MFCFSPLQLLVKACSNQSIGLGQSFPIFFIASFSSILSDEAAYSEKDVPREACLGVADAVGPMPGNPNPETPVRPVREVCLHRQFECIVTVPENVVDVTGI